MMAAARTTRRACSATWLAWNIAMVVCFCGRGALGFVCPPSASTGAVKPHRAVEAPTVVAATAVRPKASFRLYSSKGPSPPTDFMDRVGGLGRELTMEEKILALQKEVQAQAAAAELAEKGQEEMENEEGVVMIPATGQGEVEDEDSTEGFVPDEGFVDEGKKILWPNNRRAAQLTVLAVVAQIAFVLYIIFLNAVLNAIPPAFEKLVEIIKSGDWSQLSQIQLPQF